MKVHVQVKCMSNASQMHFKCKSNASQMQVKCKSNCKFANLQIMWNSFGIYWKSCSNQCSHFIWICQLFFGGRNNSFISEISRNFIKVFTLSIIDCMNFQSSFMTKSTNEGENFWAQAFLFFHCIMHSIKSAIFTIQFLLHTDSLTLFQIGSGMTLLHGRDHNVPPPCS